MSPETTNHAPDQNTPEILPASPGLRFINYTVDRVLSFTLALLASLILIVIISVLKIKMDHSMYLVVGLGIFIIFQFLYYVVFERIFGRTFAKFLTKTQVISQVGNLSTTQTIGRTFARLIPFNEFSILTGKRIAWHDSLNNTLVVKSSNLPVEQRPKQFVDKTMTIIAVILILLPASFFVVYPVYENLTGGKRIDLPNSFPDDLVLKDIKKVDNEKADYFTMKYEGNNRTIRITRLIAGYNYEPDKDCVYMTPVDTNIFIQNSYAGMKCEEIYNGKNRVYSVTTTPGVLKHPITDVPHYYIKDPPFVLVIRADNGTISQQEVIDMAQSGLKTYTFEELEAIANR